ncbi:TDT family transporter [Gemella cuniculi]|uniref:TDT family transporter n=1 Tax=Gemella cuniculi TaxID=150240 RepID=UPI0004221828|nr:TDT family transporter [Gemella cuniculi]
MNLIKNIPTPIAGLALGSVALGNLLQIYSSVLQIIFSIFSLVIIVLLTLKFISSPNKLKIELKNPIITTVLATYPMSIMLLSVFLKKHFNYWGSLLLWLIGMLLDIFVVCFVTVNFILKKHHIKYIYPTWFISFVGPAVITVTAVSYNLEILGKIFFFFSFINYIVLIPLVLYRVYIYGRLTPGDLPTLTVFAAPGGLLLASYMIGITDKSILIINILLILACIFYIFVLIQLPFLLNRRFYPSFSAFTFPLVICAIAFQKVSIFYQLDTFPILKISIYLNESLAVIIVIYIYFCYLKDIIIKARA